MKDNKFRVWCSVVNKMFDWNSLESMKYLLGDEKLMNPFIVVPNRDTDTVMQFIGFQDINGTDIYEGDVLHQLDPVIWNPFTVEYSDQSASFIAGGLISKITIKEQELVIVGNIYENPEVLTQK